jgi:chromosome partitioning protein
MILAVVNAKVGTGNSTIATNLAALFVRQSTAALLVNADLQQSELGWQRDRSVHLPPISVIGLPAPSLHRENSPIA